ncbi:MAG: UDP-2,4-diacetamido-2,4,6-trideoxy-beta-L-altropyranose hydrolase [Flavobacteriaceae bacterium]|nr:UDP-2,4-diacetamido-2,4,6-trideoxy-beta-L-altropyranose hydrolase [Flavobacteriaceae bacterium]
MRVVFRVDASIDIGTGHVMRCLALAEKLRVGGADCEFICREHKGNLIDLVKQKGFHVESLRRPRTPNMLSFACKGDHADWLGCSWQEDAKECLDKLTHNSDWLVVDHYGLDTAWENELRKKCRRSLCIDDLADRAHRCELLLDQTLERDSDHYDNFVNGKTKKLIGPKYALLRGEFSDFRKKSLARRQFPKLRHIFLSMGGVDRDNFTTRILLSLKKCSIKSLEKITVIMGHQSMWQSEIRETVAGMTTPTILMTAVDNIAEIMSECDLAIGASGITTWERCSLGIPSIQISVVKNQDLICHAIEASGASKTCKPYQIEKMFCNIVSEVSSVSALKTMSKKARNITDGKGATRVAKIMFGIQNEN